ncbi:MAG: hypothetical protein IAF94_00380 [Pirellulaceae bacterium]|nr:hypothetical protein [Pirellulaceae bacterium]
MNRDDLMYWATLGSAACWLLCFWWMYRISSTQNALLTQLREQGARIESLSKVEHDLLKDVHPQIGTIADKVDEVAANVRGNAS